MALFKEHLIHIDTKRAPKVSLQNIVAGETGNKITVFLTNEGDNVPLISGTHRVVLRVDSALGTMRQDSSDANGGITFNSTHTTPIDTYGSVTILLSAGAYAAGMNRCRLEVMTTASASNDTLIASAEFSFRAGANRDGIYVGPDPAETWYDKVEQCMDFIEHGGSVGGYVDDTSRRVSAELSTRGWHRVLHYTAVNSNMAEGAASTLFKLRISRHGHTHIGETHEITLSLVRYNYAWYEEETNCGSMLIPKVRYVQNDVNGYIDIYYDSTSANYVSVYFDVSMRSAYQASVVPSTLEQVAASVTGETVLTTHTFRKPIKCILFSDSFGAGRTKDVDAAGTRETVNMLHETIEDLTGIKMINHSVSGAGYIVTTMPPPSQTVIVPTAYEIMSTYEEDVEAADLIVLAFGANDQRSNKALGAVDTTDEDTVIGQVRKCVEYVNSVNGEARVIIVAPWNCTVNGAFPNYQYDYQGSFQFSRGMLAERLKEFCARYWIPYIDLKDGPFSSWSLPDYMGADFVHPNDNGYLALGRYLAAKIGDVIK